MITRFSKLPVFHVENYDDTIKLVERFGEKAQKNALAYSQFNQMGQSISKIDILKEPHKVKLTELYNKTVDEINNLGNTDFTNPVVQSKIIQSFGSVLEDSDVKAGIEDTKKVRKIQSQYDKIMTDPKYQPLMGDGSAYRMYQRELESYIANPDTKARFKGEFIPYDSYREKIQSGAKDIKMEVTQTPIDGFRIQETKQRSATALSSLINQNIGKSAEIEYQDKVARNPNFNQELIQNANEVIKTSEDRVKDLRTKQAQYKSEDPMYNAYEQNIKFEEGKVNTLKEKLSTGDINQQGRAIYFHALTQDLFNQHAVKEVRYLADPAAIYQDKANRDTRDHNYQIGRDKIEDDLKERKYQLEVFSTYNKGKGGGNSYGTSGEQAADTDLQDNYGLGSSVPLLDGDIVNDEKMSPSGTWAQANKEYTRYAQDSIGEINKILASQSSLRALTDLFGEKAVQKLRMGIANKNLIPLQEFIEANRTGLNNTTIGQNLLKHLNDYADNADILQIIGETSKHATAAALKEKGYDKAWGIKNNDNALVKMFEIKSKVDPSISKIITPLREKYFENSGFNATYRTKELPVSELKKDSALNNLVQSKIKSVPTSKFLGAKGEIMKDEKLALLDGADIEGATIVNYKGQWLLKVNAKDKKDKTSLGTFSIPLSQTEVANNIPQEVIRDLTKVRDLDFILQNTKANIVDSTDFSKRIRYNYLGDNLSIPYRITSVEKGSMTIKVDLPNGKHFTTNKFTGQNDFLRRSQALYTTTLREFKRQFPDKTQKELSAKAWEYVILQIQN